MTLRRDNRGNLGISSHNSPFKKCDPSLEPSRQEDSNEGSQHVFSLRKKIFELFSVSSFIWSPAF